MRNNKRILAIYAACVLSALLLASCNFFEWLNPPVEGVSWQAYVARGDRYFEDKYFDKAMDSYSNALILNPYSSQARSGYARSTFWQFVPGFMNLLAIKMAESTNGSVYDVLLEVFNSEEGRQAINAGADSAFYERIVATLDSPYGIVNGTSDNVVSSENFEMNLMLIVAYASDLVLSLLDTDGDGALGSANGDLIFVTNGTFAINDQIMNLESNATVLLDISESNTISETLSNIMAGHDSAEYVLGLVKFIVTKIGYFDKIFEAAVRPRPYLELLTPDIIGGDNVGEYYGYSNLYESLIDAYTNSNSLSPYGDYIYEKKLLISMVEDSTVLLNDLHKVLVGVNAYDGSVQNFQPTLWETHNGGIKATVQAFGELTNNLTSTNVDDLILELTNSFSMEELSNLMQQFSSLM